MENAMDMSDLIKPIIGLAVGSIGTYLGLYWKIQKSLIAEYDKVLRADRTKCYAALWAATEPLAIYAPPGPVTGDSVRELSVALRHWYFATGGIFLSEKARDAYFMLQKAIASTPCSAGVAQIAPEQLAVLRQASTDLRTVLTADVGSRNKPMLQNRHEI
jgi:hypothetical protein